MKNIIEYLWQTDQALKFGNDSGTVVVQSAWVKQFDGTERWYFFSEKQGKLLRKKKQNTSVANYLLEMEAKRQNGYAGICTQYEKGGEMQRYVISNTELVELMHSQTTGYVFVDISAIRQMCFFEVRYLDQEITSQFMEMPLFWEISSKEKESERKPNQRVLNNATLSIVRALESKLTLGKSALKELELICGLSSEAPTRVWVLWSDRITLENDYYKVGFNYNHTQATESGDKKPALMPKSLVESEELEQWVCDGCLKEKHSPKVTTQICQDDALFVRGALGISKYGILGKDFIEVCQYCISVLRSR